MAMSTTYPVQLELTGDNRVARWRPLVQWLLAIPHFAVASALSTLRNVLTAISLFTVLFTKRIPRQVFDAIAMTYRYEWRSASYGLFLHDQYPPFDFESTAGDDGTAPYTAMHFTYPEELSRWKPLYKWLLAVPHYVVLFGLLVVSLFVMVFGFFAVVVTGAYPVGARDFLVGVYRYGLRVQAYVGLLTDQYPPFAVRS
ncbi:MAG TPA: DUF4389 domain-containing protein [Acidimicrobiales bacterium]|nr:DUF4389 domain-containing protein [Acidimicrobiales bacterium]